jgi:hypothetical protein
MKTTRRFDIDIKLHVDKHLYYTLLKETKEIEF